MAAQDSLVSPRRFKGPEVQELLDHYWPGMDRTRQNAIESGKVIAGEDQFVMPSTFKISGADQYIAGLPHPRTVPQRLLQKTIARRPHLSIPLGPKGLGLTPQRLTTRVEEPLNAICMDRRAGFQWEQMCALMLFEGWAASVTVLDPADWEKRPSQWEDEDEKTTYKRRYRIDNDGREDGDDNYSGDVDHVRAKNRYEMDLDIFRARNVPIRHRAISIRQCAPIFGPNMSVEGLIISQEFSESRLRREFRFDEGGLLTPTGGNGHDESGTSKVGSSGRGTLTRIEAWLIDEDGLPYVSYCIKGQHAVEAYWKAPGKQHDGAPATLDLKDRFGISRLPVSWAFGLGNPGESDPDKRAMGVIEPFAQSWRSVRAKMTAINVATMFLGFPVLIEESERGMGDAGIEDDEPTMPDIMPMKITSARPGTTLRQLEIQAASPEVFRAIDLELGTVADESPGKSNKDQSGFSQSMAEAFEELALTTVHESLGRLYEDHGSYVLEAGKRLPEKGRRPDQPKSGYAPITVFASTDVPVSEKPESKRNNDPMTLDPDLIDETFTTVAQYDRSMSIPEKQQAMEEVARNLMTRRDFLEKTGHNSPETVELELMLETIRSTEAYQTYAIKLMTQVQGAEELEEIMKGQSEGIADEAGLPASAGQGVMQALPPGMMPALQPGMPGVPEGGSVTGMSAPQYGQNALAGIVGGGTMAAPISNAAAAGGVIPADLPTPMVGGV